MQITKLGNGQAVVGEMIRLSKPYDDAQEWLPFMKGVLLTFTEPTPSPVDEYVRRSQEEQSRRALEKRRGNPKIRPSAACRQLHHSAYRQHALPFFEARQISGNEYEAMVSKTDWGGMYVQEDGRPITTIIEGVILNSNKTHALCKQYMTGRYFFKQFQKPGGIHYVEAVFETEEDATLFSLCMVKR